jgi:polysaccharide biosynthesis/export protein
MSPVGSRTLPYYETLLVRLRALVVAVAATVCASTAAAQNLSNLPSPQEAQQLLATRPDLVAQLQAEIAQSGLTPDQIRERLVEAGYPANFLDAYLSAGGSSSSGNLGPSAGNVLSAVNQLGLADSCDLSADSTALRFGGMASAPLSVTGGAAGGANGLGANGGLASGGGLATGAAGSALSGAIGGSASGMTSGDSLLARNGTSGALATSGGLSTTGGTGGAGGLGGGGAGNSALNSLSAPDSASAGYRSAILPPARNPLCGNPLNSVYGFDTTSRRRVRPPPPLGGELKIFGMDLFANRTTQFQPNIGGPVDQSYKLGPGDQLVLILTGDVELARSLQVTREGFIVIPQVGEIDVNNLTLAELSDVLYERLSKVYSGVRRGPNATTHFSISVSRLRSNQVFVVGDVAQPGSYQVSSAGTLMTALYAAQGPSVNGSMRRIQVRRRGMLVDSLDVYDYLLHGDASHDVRLETGDVVFVPVHGPRVKVTGEVTRPAIYELKGSESLRDVIQFAGGFTDIAARGRVQITRVLSPGERGPAGHDRVAIEIASSAFDTSAGPSIPMEAGDSVHVFAVNPTVQNRLAVTGAVWQPGPMGFTPGMRLSDALKLAGGVKPDVYMGTVLIARLQTDSTREQLRTSLQDSTGTPTEDVILQDNDDIHVFSLAEFRPHRYVAIAGAVRRSGRFAYHDGMTMRDLVLLAGGVSEGAYLENAEIARLPENRAGGVTAVSIRVPLDSTYLFDRGPNGEWVGPPGLPAPRTGSPEVRLAPYDNVLIFRQPDWELQRTVVVSGEVRFPGRYALERKSETIRDIIARAGGLTHDAYAEGMVMIRAVNGTGRVGVDLPSALHRAKARDNLILSDGDSLYIPTYSGVVRVVGAVNSPVTVAYVPGKDILYYVAAAGGPTIHGDQGHAFVTQANGKVESIHHHFLLPSSVPVARPGSTIMVPTKPPPNFTNSIALFTVLGGVLSSLVAIVAVIVK